MGEERMCRQCKDNHVLWYRGYCFIEIFLCFLSLFFVLVKLFSGHSLCYWIGVEIHFFHKIIDTKFVNIDAVNAIAETIGFGSILIGWVYANLDKEELGIRYADLLDDNYHNYHYFVLAHLVSVLFCLWMVKIKYLEAACSFMTTMLWGSIVHWKVLSNIIFSTQKRKSMAINQWSRIVSEEKNDLHKLLSCIYGMEQVLPFDDGISLRKMCNPMFLAIQQYADSFCLNAHKSQKMQVFRDMVSIWECILEKRSQNQRDIFLKNLFEVAVECSNIDEKEEISSLVISATYICWLYESRQKEQRQEEHLLGDITLRVDYLISNMLAKIANTNRNNRYPEVFSTCLCVLYWMSFLSGKLCDVNILSYQIKVSLTKTDKNVMETLACFLFGNLYYDQYFATVWSLLSSQALP